MRRFTKEWLLRQPVSDGTRRPVPFSRIPTRVAYFTPGWNYIGKPNASAYHRFRRFIDNSSLRARWYCLEFDRAGVFRKHGTNLFGHFDRTLGSYYYAGIDTRQDVAGVMVSRPHSVRRVAGHYVYTTAVPGSRLSMTTIVGHRDWLKGMGWYVPTRRDEAAL